MMLSLNLFCGNLLVNYHMCNCTACSDLGLKDSSFEQFVQRSESQRCGQDPITQCRARYWSTFPAIDSLQPIQRAEIGEFADNNVRKQPRCSQTSRKRRFRLLSHDDLALAFRTGDRGSRRFIHALRARSQTAFRLQSSAKRICALRALFQSRALRTIVQSFV